MHLSLKKLGGIVLVILVLGLLFDGVETYFHVQTGLEIAGHTSPFERTIIGAPMRILVTGDSTALGTGASDPRFSTAGRFGEEYPQAEIINISQNGLRLEEHVVLLEDSKLGSFDIIVAQIGANDIIYFTELNEVEENLRSVLSILSPRGKQVVVLHSGDIGDAPLIPWYISPIYTYRTYLVRSIYLDVISEYENVAYVDIFKTDEKFFQENEVREYAAQDLLHLNNAGYGLLFKEIMNTLSTFPQ
jgi:lysophospholipase L1-like esterase